MKIKFTKLPITDRTIKVSLDGGQSFTDYNVSDVHESGIPLENIPKRKQLPSNQVRQILCFKPALPLLWI